MAAVKRQGAGLIALGACAIATAVMIEFLSWRYFGSRAPGLLFYAVIAGGGGLVALGVSKLRSSPPSP